MSGRAELAKQLAEAKRKLAVEAEMVADQATADLANFKMHFDAAWEAAQAWRQARLEQAIAAATRKVDAEMASVSGVQQDQLDKRMVAETEAKIAAALARSEADKAEAAAEKAEQAEMDMNMAQAPPLKKEAARRLKAAIASAAVAKKSAAEAAARAVRARNRAAA